MKSFILLISSLILLACSTKLVETEIQTTSIKYTIDVSNHSNDLFHVIVDTRNLTPENNIYHFAATAPGTYQILNFGRFVKNVRGFDKLGNEIKVEQLSTNQWEIEDPEKLAKLAYVVEDSFDAEVEEYPVSPMCGSGIEEDFIVLNTFAVLGYFEGLQSVPLKLELDYNSQWSIGTALLKDKNGNYVADNYDHLADSPILIGKLSYAETFVNDIAVQVYLYSSDTATTATRVLSLAEDILQSASGFIGYSPIPHYKFLMCLIDEETYMRNKLYGGGALEHSYSSLYVLPSSQDQLDGLRSTMAHEFLHILTPLFLHSEIIHTYNFEEPTASQHIWLYEGVTEWASDIMQLRSDIISVEVYLRIISGKLRMSDNFDKNISLKEMALTSYSESGFGNFFNFYERGAVTAALLDIRILELSGGKMGLREVFLKLLKKYGKHKPFSENDFFKEIVTHTYPEINDFIDRYIIGSEKLPYIEYFSKLGFSYIPEQVIDEGRPTIGTNLSMNEEMEIITFGVQDDAKKWGLKEGDVILKVNREIATFENIRDILAKLYKLKVGDHVNFEIRRDNKISLIEGNLLQRKKKHVFEEMDELSETQKKLRAAWKVNLSFEY